MLIIPRKMEHGRTDHYVRETVGKRHSFNGANLKILRRQSRRQRCRELANVFNTFSILVHGKDLTALAKQMNQIAPVTAAGVEHAHSGRNVPAQDLVEDININLSELLLNA